MVAAGRSRIRLRASLATLRRPFVPANVLLDGHPLKRSRWRYDSGSGELSVSFRALRSALRVVPRR